MRRTKPRTAAWSVRRPHRMARRRRSAARAGRTHAKLDLGQTCVSASSVSRVADTCVPTRIAIDFCGREQTTRRCALSIVAGEPHHGGVPLAAGATSRCRPTRPASGSSRGSRLQLQAPTVRRGLRAAAPTAAACHVRQDRLTGGDTRNPRKAASVTGGGPTCFAGHDRHPPSSAYRRQLSATGSSRESLQLVAATNLAWCAVHTTEHSTRTQLTKERR